jgi:hypothetical protein
MRDKDVTPEKVFEVVGVYFANCYWNTFYTLAFKEWGYGKHESMEASYRNIVDSYSKAFCSKDDDYYNRIMKDIFIEYKKYLETSDTFGSFIDVLSSMIIPEKNYDKLSSNDTRKREIIRSVLNKAVMRFSIWILQFIQADKSEVKKVCDKNQRHEVESIAKWKIKFIEIFLQEKNEFCTLLLAQSSGIDINREEIPHIPKQVYDKLQNKIKDLIQENSDLINKTNKYVRYIEELKKIIAQQDQELKAKVVPVSIIQSQGRSSSRRIKHKERSRSPSPNLLEKERDEPKKQEVDSRKEELRKKNLEKFKYEEDIVEDTDENIEQIGSELS